VIEVRRPSLPWIFGAESPLAPFSIRKPRIFPRRSSPRRRQIGDGALLIQVFEPVRL